MQKQVPEMQALEVLAVRIDMLVTEARAAIADAGASAPLAQHETALRSIAKILDKISAATLEAYEQASAAREPGRDDGM